MCHGSALNTLYYPAGNHITTFQNEALDGNGLNDWSGLKTFSMAFVPGPNHDSAQKYAVEKMHRSKPLLIAFVLWSKHVHVYQNFIKIPQKFAACSLNIKNTKRILNSIQKLIDIIIRSPASRYEPTNNNLILASLISSALQHFSGKYQFVW